MNNTENLAGRILEWIFVVVLLSGGIWFEGRSFLQLKEMRQLERPPTTEVRFDDRGDHSPATGAPDSSRARDQKATASLWSSIAGLLCLSFAVCGLCYKLGIHRLLSYLGLLALVQFSVLTGFGWNMMSSNPTSPGTTARVALNPPMLGWIYIVCGLVICPAAVWVGLKQIRSKRWIENLPTSDVGGVTFGLTEINGFTDTVEDQEPTRAPLSGERCIYYRYLTRERVGKDWTVREDREHWQPFRCTDGSNYLRVMPEGAEGLARKHTQEQKSDWQYEEWRIDLGDLIYAIGHAGVDPETGTTLRLQKPEESHLPFILSNYSEREVMLQKAFKGMMSLSLAFCALTTSILLLLGMHGGFAPADYLLSAVLGPVLLAVVAVVTRRNDLVFLQQHAARNWGNIAVCLAKRRDLVPGLEALAARFLAHERVVQETLTDLRRLMNQDTSRAPTAVSAALVLQHSATGKCLSLLESNPRLKGSEELAAVSRALTRLENEVALIRKGYNDAVELYNTRIRSFPDVILAKLSGFEPLECFTWEPQPIELSGADAPAPADDAVPASLVRAAAEPASAITAVFALVIGRQADHASECLELVARKTSADFRKATEQLLPEVQGLDDGQRLNVVDCCLPALIRLSEDQLRGVAGLVDRLTSEDASLSLFEYTLNRILQRQLNVRAGNCPSSAESLHDFGPVVREISLVLSFLAQLGGADDVVPDCFTEAVRVLNEPAFGFEWVPSKQATFGDAIRALDRLAQLDVDRRASLVRASRTILDGSKPENIRQKLFQRAIAEGL